MSSSKSPSLRRIQADIRELALDPSERYHATPLENDMFEWHFTIRGAPKTDFDGGVYHGRILLPPEYPFKPPHIIFLTPSGRFETNTKICLSFSAFHPELWQPAWGVRLILEALIAFLPSPPDGAIGALDWSSVERKRLAKESVNWSCPHCGKIIDVLPKLKPADSSGGGGGEGAGEASSSAATKNRFQKEIEELKRLQELEHKQSDADKEDKPNEGEDKSSSTTSSGDAKMPPSSQQQEDGAEEEHGTPATHAATAAAATTDEVLKKATPQGSTATTAAEKVTVETVRLGEESDEELVNPPATTSTTTTTAATGLFYDVPNQNPYDPVLFPENNQVDTGGDNINNNNDMKTSWLIDPVLHAIILILSIICCLLLKKIQALCQDLRHINLG
jgi:ubiquitin-conjugating enzyme E2 J1